MNEPVLSREFTLDDIRALRDYNSFRHAGMSVDEINEDLRISVEVFHALMKDFRTEELAKKASQP